MGLCIDADETPHGIDFELRSESIVFYPDEEGGSSFEVTKEYLKKVSALCNDPGWRDRLMPK